MKSHYYINLEGRRWSYYSGRRTNRGERSSRGSMVFYHRVKYLKGRWRGVFLSISKGRDWENCPQLHKRLCQKMDAKFVWKSRAKNALSSGNIQCAALVVILWSFMRAVKHEWARGDLWKLMTKRDVPSRISNVPVFLFIIFKHIQKLHLEMLWVIFFLA